MRTYDAIKCSEKLSQKKRDENRLNEDNRRHQELRDNETNEAR